MQLIFRLRGSDDVGCETHVLVAIWYYIKTWSCMSSHVDVDCWRDTNRKRDDNVNGRHGKP
jgi:hypothetical protein